MRRLLQIFFTFIFIFNAYSLENRFKYITPEDGLSQGNITCIFQDSKGFMWFGTFNGLNRYDGYTIKVFQNKINDSLSLGNGHVKYICEDDEQKLWLGTFGGGVSVYFPKSGIFRNINKVKVGNKVITLKNLSGVAYRSGGDIWVLDETQGLFVFDINLNFKKAYLPGSNKPGALPGMYFFALNFDSKGSLWIGAGNGTLFRYNPGKDNFEKYIFEDRIAAADDGIRSMYIDKKDVIWIGTTSQGAYSFNSQSKEVKNYRQGTTIYDLSGNSVRAFYEDNDGNMLIGTDGGGLNILNQGSGEISKIRYELGNLESLSTDAIYAIYYDRTETLWIGTYAGGLNYIGKYRNKFNTYRPDPLNPNSLSYKNVKCFLQDSDGDIWVGTDGGGIDKFNRADNTFTHYKADKSNPSWLQTNVIINLMQDADGDIYIGSYGGGLTIFNKKENKFKQYLSDDSNPSGIGGIHVWYSFQDSYGDIWIGLLAVGLDKFDKATQTFKHYKSDLDDNTTLNSPNIKVIAEDKNRKLWIGTEGGGLHLYNRETDNFTRFFHDASKPNSLSDDDVRSIFEDSKNRLWVGTGHGLNLMDREKGIFKVFTSDNSKLTGDIINDILEDEEGNLWISSNKGISKFNPETGKCRNYDITDGLQGNEFNYTSALHTSDGEFYFGGKNGFNVFYPKNIKDNPHIPSVALTGFQIANKSLDGITVKINGKKEFRSVPYIDKIKLSSKENVIGFEFSALDYGNPVKNKYKYKLEGFDDTLREVSSQKRYVSYSNLKGGRYTLRIMGSNSDDVWNEEGLAIKIIVTPPLWKRTWFIILLVLIVSYFVWQYLKRRQEKIIEEKHYLEERINAGMSEVEKQKLEIQRKDNELRDKIESEKIQNWQNSGLSKISAVISKNKDDLYKLSKSLILEIVELINVEQGAIYLLNDDNPADPFLEVMAAFAPDEERLKGKRIDIGEGNVGTCYQIKKVIKIEDLPDEYSTLSSGLGALSLKHLAIIPLKLDESVIGAIELLSFHPIEEHKSSFVERAGETLTSILSALRANEQSKKLLETQRLLAEQSAAQEEELRQNLEELQATQEELQRQMETVNKAQSELTKEKMLIDTMLENAKEKIYFKDSQSRFIKVSKSMAEGFKVKSVEDLIGKSDFDFFTEEHARPAFEDEMNIIKTGEPIIDKIEKETHADGRITYVSTTKMPIYDENQKITGTFGISKDVTEAIQMEHEIKQRNEELLAQEEELRQNLEEMQTIQDSLQNQITENEKIQVELSKEKYLMDALMNSVPEYIYFKDLNSKFIKNSRSHASVFGFDNPKQLAGKSDFDFFDAEHAKPAFDDEQKIIKTGEPILNLIEKEIKKDGSVTYVSTTKMPLYNEENKIVGTFGISKDVSEAIQMEHEIKQRNEELLAQEEELRQNLEEMQAVQESLENQINENKKMQEDLVKEKALLDAIMNNLPDYLYFKDKDSRFIRISKSMLPLFPVETLEEMIGKSDFDFQPREIAQKYYEGELEIIKSGKGIINDVAHEVMENGLEQWVATTKLPLYDQTGKCIGTFGISKNITELKQHEIAIEKTANELKQKEKELLDTIKKLKEEITNLKNRNK